VPSTYPQEVRPFTATASLPKPLSPSKTRDFLKDLRDRTVKVEKLNHHLEQRVADQVGEIERISRLPRFLPPNAEMKSQERHNDSNPWQAAPRSANISSEYIARQRDVAPFANSCASAKGRSRHYAARD
jgi:hypothetical protein